MKIAKSYMNIIQFMKSEEVTDPKAKPKGKDAAPAPVTYETEISGIIGPGEQTGEVQGKKEAKKDPKAAPVQAKNVFDFKIDFFAENKNSKFSHTPVIGVTFIDPNTNKLLSKSVLSLSAVVQYAEVKITPEKINFGDMCVGKEVTRNTIIENVGVFPTMVVFEKLDLVVKRFLVTNCLTPFDDSYEKNVASIQAAD